MLKENECFFIAVTTVQDGHGLIIPIKFHTREYEKAIQLVKCITDNAPERKLFITDDTGIIDHVIRRRT